MPDLWLVRHGETAWSAAGRHTGRTDVPLTPRGEQQGILLRRQLHEQEFSLVLTSPLRRARDTCAIAGYGASAEADADLAEWDYGAYEGRTGAEIRHESAGWDIWSRGVPGGETAADVGARADRVLGRVASVSGNVALFAHAHLLRILAARWLRLEPAAGRHFALATASVSVLGHEGTRPVLRRWNDTSHLNVEETTP
ncbi:MAG: histidine phosphatase family protein [bacterium]